MIQYQQILWDVLYVLVFLYFWIYFVHIRAVASLISLII
jgi:hypothetical protein